MSQRLQDFLAREASEYLEELVRLLQRPGAPDPAELQRAARGVRGSAQLAGADEIARGAGEMEDVAASLLAGTLTWSPAVRARLVDGSERLERQLHGAEAFEVVPISDLLADVPDAVAPPGDSGVAAADVPDEVAAPSDSRGAGADEPVVPIENLLLRGEPALRSAAALRPRLQQALERRDLDEARALASELFELLELGMSGPAE